MIQKGNFMKELFKNKELRKKILIIFAAMVFIRMGSVIPIPGVNTEYMKEIMSNSGLGFLNMITGNSLSQMSLFALNISPYITASIIIQLLAVVFTSLEEMRKDGKTGREKMERITMVTGVVLALLQSLFMTIGFGKQGLLTNYTWYTVAIMTIAWTAGAALLMFIGNKITKMEMGNGISYILVCNILSTFPNDILTIREVIIDGKIIPYQIVNSVIAGAVLFVVIAICVVLSTSVKNIPITFSGKMSGRTIKQDLPIMLNTCGVMPIIFSSSLMSIPILISAFFPNVKWLAEASEYLSQSHWFDGDHLKYTAGVVIYIILTYLFTYFYLNISFNATEITQNLKQQGAMIPGIRPGKPTKDYLEKTSFQIAMLGSTYMLLIILITNAICNATGVGILSIGGTSILICVTVVIESSKILKTAIQSAKSRSYYTEKKGSALRLW